MSNDLFDLWVSDFVRSCYYEINSTFYLSLYNGYLIVRLRLIRHGPMNPVTIDKFKFSVYHRIIFLIQFDKKGPPIF